MSSQIEMPSFIPGELVNLDTKMSVWDGLAEFINYSSIGHGAHATCKCQVLNGSKYHGQIYEFYIRWLRKL